MNIKIPRNNNSEMLVYLWKIIDLPSISLYDLLFTISYELFLFPPKKARSLIKSCIKNQLLIIDNENNLKLSLLLENRLKNWQKKRKNDIINKFNDYKSIIHLQNEIKTGLSTNFNNLIKRFIDAGTLNRAAAISNSSYKLNEIDTKKGIIKSKVAGTKEESYIIEIDMNNKFIRHNCHDFASRRATDKKFCKHLIKLFLLLKDKNEDIALFFLNDLVENIDDWDFMI
ncbi:MAG: hypothetical protein ACFFB0_01150 [Promethearchaeota archaeon]